MQTMLGQNYASKQGKDGMDSIIQKAVIGFSECYTLWRMQPNAKHVMDFAVFFVLYLIMQVSPFRKGCNNSIIIAGSLWLCEH